MVAEEVGFGCSPEWVGRTLAAVLPDQCWGHHREHLRQLVDWLKATPEPG